MDYTPTLRTQKITGGLLNMTISVKNPEKLKEWEHAEEEFKQYARELYINIVAEVHKYLLRVTPMHTGKLRGGWTAFLDKYQKDYSKQLFDVSLYDSYKKSNTSKSNKSYQFSMSAVGEGKKYSQLLDKLPNELSVSLNNLTPYGTYLNFGTSEVASQHFVEKAIYKGEYWLRLNFDAWLQTMSKAGKVASPPPVKEIDV
jgi:hypothetical protein